MSPAHPVDPDLRLWQRIEVQPNGCWNWVGACSSLGYGQFSLNARQVATHRYMYERFVGPIPQGMHIDHLCRNRACCNYEHLEVVTPRENSLRGFGPAAINARRTVCKSGHPLTPENVYRRPDGHRACRTCRQIWEKDRQRRIAAERLPVVLGVASVVRDARRTT